jgi:hypothetical protein
MVRIRKRGKGKQSVVIDDPGFVHGEPSEFDEEGVMLKAAAEIFGDLVDELGPPLKGLSVRSIPFRCFFVDYLTRPRRAHAPPPSNVSASPSFSHKLIAAQKKTSSNRTNSPNW